MPLRCRAEHDGEGIVLSGMKCADDAESLRCFFAEKTIRVVKISGREGDCRLFMPGVSMAALRVFVAGSNIELID